MAPGLERANSRAAACKPGNNSFTGDTKVLLGDGSAKPIDQVRVGDEVTATDPRTGITGTRRGAATVNDTGVKVLVDITIDTGGGTVTATDNHPMWVDSRHAWIAAEQLRTDDQLRDPAGDRHAVRRVVPRTEIATVHNLAVDNLHTYYVLAGGTPVLAHNNACEIFTNTMPDDLAEELAIADRLGVKPVTPGTAAFDDIIDSGIVKWAVREDGILVIVPKDIDGVGEIAHSVLTRGAPVRAAGEASIGGNAQIGYFGLEITNHSGHFLPSLESLQIGLEAFAAAGVRF
ncbi:polymorphic toxin-type HINT domain-containing protein [Saccharothrix coeruleofusca]|uniref:Hint domain-containing protein n=1 Tax=Saccharothrix coeruleofusca TaxID=33919 RepID=A0A918AQU6_9PSEU|nr:polymorphic toxin-type HINT domain-containing protein [Saccharothrix coeruleofusca]GGP72560.1 hypothetical protein GCM10010185_52360 [Saccharothrix coeruleofusca]